MKIFAVDCKFPFERPRIFIAGESEGYLNRFRDTFQIKVTHGLKSLIRLFDFCRMKTYLGKFFGVKPYFLCAQIMVSNPDPGGDRIGIDAGFNGRRRWVLFVKCNLGLQAAEAAVDSSKWPLYTELYLGMFRIYFPFFCERKRGHHAGNGK